MDFTPDEQQSLAIRACLDIARRVVPITGPAGTGKTSIIRVVADKLQDAGYTVALAAPTGKAARRIREATGIQAQTFHRLLEFTNPGEPDPKTGKAITSSFPMRDRTKPIDADVIIGDEYSMASKQIHADIVSAIKPGGRLLVFGDENQLQPIEEGANAKGPSRFIELIHKFDGIKLATVHRTGNGSGIADNARRVLRGMAPVKRDDFTMVYTSQPVQEVLSHLKGKEDLYRTPEYQIITPTNISWVGTYKLNVAVQSQLQPHSRGWFELMRSEWDSKRPVRVRVGDKVVVNKNLYNINTNDGMMGVFNGETGIILSISPTGEIELDLGDRIAILPQVMSIDMGDKVTRMIYPHRELALAYVLTTHKVQGSEYKGIVYVQNKSQTMVLNRSNLYTGITRARETAHVITDMASMAKACSTTGAT